MTEVDPDPPGHDRPVLAGRPVPVADDPTDGGRHGEIGEVPSIAADRPDDGGPGYPVGGGSATEESDDVPVADPGPEA